MTCCCIPSTVGQDAYLAIGFVCFFPLVSCCLSLVVVEIRRRGVETNVSTGFYFSLRGKNWGKEEKRFDDLTGHRWGLEIKSELSEKTPLHLCVSLQHKPKTHERGRLSPQITNQQKKRKLRWKDSGRQYKTHTREREATWISCHLVVVKERKKKTTAFKTHPHSMAIQQLSHARPLLSMSIWNSL